MDAFQRRHPAVNILFFIFAAVLAMKMNHPVFLAVSLTASLSYCLRLKGPGMLKFFFGAMAPLAVFIVIINFFISHYGITTLATLPDGNNLTLEALVNGGVTAAEISAMLLWFFALSEVMTEEKLLYLTGRIFPRITLLIMMVLRFIPLFARQYKETSEARKSMFTESKLKNAVTSLDGVVTRALEHSIDTADSMKGMGYGSGRIRSYSRISVYPVDVIFFLVLLIFISCTFALHKIFGLTAYYNPVITFSGASVQLLITAFVYALFCFSPLIYDLSEVLRWRSLYSKI